jgi:thimet oligopeptidase
VHPAKMYEMPLALQPLISAFVTELFLNTDIAHVLRQAATLLTSLSSSQQRFVTTTLQEYTRNGLTLPKEKQQDLTRINKRISEISVVCDSTLAETTHSLEVLPSDLDGLPQDFIKEHPANERGYSTLTTKTTDLFPILRYAHKRTIAEQLYILSENRGADITLPCSKAFFLHKENNASRICVGPITYSSHAWQNVQKCREFLTNLHQPS